MGSRRSTQLWLLVFLAFLSVADVYSVEVMSAPNVLRVGTEENIFVECQTCSDGDRVEIKVMNHPTKAIRLTSTSVTLTATKKFQDLVQITIPAGDFSKDRNVKQYVYLQAKFPHVELEKIVLVSFRSDYIFIQTDKTLYTPSSTVHYRIFALTPDMKALDRNAESKTDASVVSEIVNPDGIVFPLDQISLTSGMYSGIYKLNEIASPGLWKVVAKFPSTPQQSYSAEFEVKEYVLPSFEVKLTSGDAFFHVDRPNITINIKAEYLFGEEVDGVAYVVFGVMQDDKKRSFPSSLQRVPVKGSTTVTLQKEHITQTFPNILDLVGDSIYVAVSVLMESGSEMVEAELRGIQIVTSPYIIHFRKTPKYFKPGMTFDVLVEVLNPDGTPAPRVKVEVYPGKLQGITSSNGMARFYINTNQRPEPMHITADVPGMSRASAKMVAHPYTSNSRSYIHISLDQAEVQLESNLKISFYLSQQDNAQSNTTYLILSRGQLVKYGQYMTRALTSMSLFVTKELLPSFRILAYYFTNDNEVVADSIWVDVKDSCMGSLQLESISKVPSYRPGTMFGLKVTGDPEATVALVAVDKGVYVLNNKHRLTQKKVWDLVEKSDIGCTPGGGRDSMSVFYDAGLLFESNKASGTTYRQEYICPTPSRRKRANNILDARTSLVSHFEEKKERQCCLEGMRETLLSYNCERRSEYIIDGPDCVNAFLHCCKQMEIQRAERKHDSLMLARSEEDQDSYSDSNDIVSRTSFPESWQWTQFILPPCRQNPLNCRTTTYETKFPLRDSITTWQFTGISISRTHGICVGEPLEVKVLKEFFIDLRLPYSAVREEQIEIKAILHNYNSEKVTVRVELIEMQHVCSSAFKRGRYRQEVEVGAKSTLSVPFIIIPLKEGYHPIEVKAVVKDFGVKDGVKKMLMVVPQGILTTSLKIITLNPDKKGVGGKQEEIINSEIPMNDLAPNTPEWTYISVTGREQISALVENAISGKSMGSLIKQPSGCGEQNMISMTLPVIATTYLDKTNQWEIVGFQKRNEALEHIKTGYQNELNYRKNDGSFAVFPDHKSSTWLTAYVAKVFAMANRLVKVPNNYICEAINFLISKTQDSDGSFREVGSIIHGEMVGDVKGADSDVSMTAFCLIAIQESRALCNDTVENFKDGIDKAVAYLENRQHNLNNSYAAAMTSYALANENKLDRQILSKFVSPELTHWPVRNAQLFTLEATGYALLALVKAKAFEDAKPVVRWFNKQQIDGGGYGSTQATIMVYQAIAEYWINAKEEEYNVNVNIEFPGRSIPPKINFNRQNHYVTRTSRFNRINQNVKVIANGTGEVTVTMASMYYTLPKEKESNCEKFELSVELIPYKMDTNEMIYKLVIKVLYKDEEKDATMSILDIGLLTGYEINTDDLNELSKGYARSISKYEDNKALSVKGSLIIYLSKVSHTQPEEIVFRIHQKHKVGVLQPAAVSIYEYYNHQHNNQTPCMKFYRPERTRGELLRLCQSNGCTCAEENCSMQRTKNISNHDRTAKACETEVTGRIDYVYRVRLENFTQSLTTDIYTMRVVEVIKEGSYDECRSRTTCDVGPLGNLRPFLSYQHCRVALNLKIGKTYLIMGMASDIHKDKENQSFQYVLGERTWIEYWPTDAECQTKEHRPTCFGMEDLVQTYVLFGCEQ